MKHANLPKYGTPDAESPEWTAADFKKARPLREVSPEFHAALKAGKVKMPDGRVVGRGRPVGRTKQSLHISLDSDIVKKLRDSGKGWQTRLNDLVRVAVGLTESAS